MNPRQVRQLEQYPPGVARAFVTLFRKCGDQFNYAVDRRDEDQREVRAYVDEQYIGITAINSVEPIEAIQETAEQMGLTIADKETSIQSDSEYGKYKVVTLDLSVPQDISASWDVPHLVVYGSLHPEIQQAAERFTFHGDVNIAGVRNHYVLFGEGVDEQLRTEFTDAVRAEIGFEDQRRDAVSDVRTAPLI